MFQKRGSIEDVSQLKGQDVFSKEKAQDLNSHVDLVVHANSFANPIFPKPGTLAVGDKGLDYRADAGDGYIQIPWTSVEGVQVDIPAGTYVRSIKVLTKETQPLEFVVSDGKNLLRVLNRYLGREKLSQAPQNVQSAARSIKEKIKGLFSKKKRSS